MERFIFDVLISDSCIWPPIQLYDSKGKTQKTQSNEQVCSPYLYPALLCVIEKLQSLYLLEFGFAHEQQLE